MSNEILRRDQNSAVVLGALTDDANQEIRMLRVDPATSRLLVSSSGGGGTFSGLQEKSTTTPDGVTQTFAFTHTPTLIFWGGALQTLTDDYTVSSNSITFTGTLTPLTGDTILNVY